MLELVRPSAPYLNILCGAQCFFPVSKPNLGVAQLSPASRTNDFWIPEVLGLDACQNTSSALQPCHEQYEESIGEHALLDLQHTWGSYISHTVCSNVQLGAIIRVGFKEVKKVECISDPVIIWYLSFCGGDTCFYFEKFFRSVGICCFFFRNFILKRL